MIRGAVPDVSNPSSPLLAGGGRCGMGIVCTVKFPSLLGGKYFTSLRAKQSEARQSGGKCMGSCSIHQIPSLRGTKCRGNPLLIERQGLTILRHCERTSVSAAIRTYRRQQSRLPQKRNQAHPNILAIPRNGRSPQHSNSLSVKTTTLNHTPSFRGIRAGSPSK